ncbi:hypothetical protein MF1_11640 [Bartonella quintana]|nr:hypothetical protein MF1_11640 [Bartonella quintana]
MNIKLKNLLNRIKYANQNLAPTLSAEAANAFDPRSLLPLKTFLKLTENSTHGKRKTS